MADEDDEIILSELPDDELVPQMHDDLYDGLRDEVVEGVNILLARGWTPYDVLTKALVEGMRIVGIDFRDGILFVPEVLLAANSMKAGMAILKPLLIETGAPRLGKMVIGTVKGDIHDIGKNLVSMMMEGAGFEVVDLGINNPAEKYLEALEREEADILGMSALLTTTMPYMKVVIDTLKDRGLRDHYIIMVGGAPLNEEFSKAIGADAYCRDAAVAVETAKDVHGAQAQPDGARLSRGSGDRRSGARRRLLRRGRARLCVDEGGDVPGVLRRQHRRRRVGPRRHVVVDEGGRGGAPMHAGRRVEAVRTPERRMQVAERIAGLAVAHAAAVVAVAGGADLEVALLAVDRIRRRRRGGKRHRVLGGVAVPARVGGQQFEVGDEGAHLGAVLRQRAAVHRTRHAAVDPVGERLGTAAGQGPRVLRRHADQRQAPVDPPAVDMAALAREIVPGIAHRRIGDLRPDQREGLDHEAASVVGRREVLPGGPAGQGSRRNHQQDRHHRSVAAALAPAIS